MTINAHVTTLNELPVFVLLPIIYLVLAKPF